MFTEEKLDALQTELNAAAESRYADEGERAIVTTVLIPQLRALISQLFVDMKLPPTPREANELCGRIDAQIQENKELLHTEGLLGPLLPRIAEIRQKVRGEIDENFKQHCREILAKHGITDRKSLLSFGPKKFWRMQYQSFGMGQAFAAAILGKAVNQVTIPILEEVADALGFEKEDIKDIRQSMLLALRKHGIIDRDSLLRFRIGRFKKTDFAPFGKGYAFAGAVFGKTSVGTTIQVLEEVADVLGFAKSSTEEIKKRMCDALSKHGIIDRLSLLYFGKVQFVEADFPPFGKGKALAGEVLGRVVRNVTTSILEEMADVLGFAKETAEERREVYRRILRDHKITDRLSLLWFGIDRFTQADFPPFGKGNAFAGAVLNRKPDRISISVLEEIADALGFAKENDEDGKRVMISVLQKHQITDRESLLGFGPQKFVQADFPPFGRGKAFASTVLGKVAERVTVPVLKEIADKLGW